MNIIRMALQPGKSIFTWFQLYRPNARMMGLLKNSPDARNGFPVGADLRVRPVAGADFLEVFLPVGVPAPGIRSICELRVSGGHAGPPLQKTQTLFHQDFFNSPMITRFRFMVK